MNNKIGILVDNLRMDNPRDAIRKAGEFGVDGFQIFCIQGAMAPEAMNVADRRDFVKFVADQNLEISALCGDLGKGFLKPEVNREILPRMKEFVDFAVDLDVRVITSHIGRLPADENDPAWAAGLEVFEDLGCYAEERGRVIAMETGPEEPLVLKRFLDKIDNRGIGVNYDPANLVMGGFDHIGGVFLLKDYIVHTHAKDAVMLLSGASVGDDPYAIRRLEVPLGQGSVAFSYYVWALQKIGYQGYLTVEREGGRDRVADMAAGVAFLKGMQPWNGLRYHGREQRDVEVDIPVLASGADAG